MRTFILWIPYLQSAILAHCPLTPPLGTSKKCQTAGAGRHTSRHGQKRPKAKFPPSVKWRRSVKCHPANRKITKTQASSTQDKCIQRPQPGIVHPSRLQNHMRAACASTTTRPSTRSGCDAGCTRHCPHQLPFQRFHALFHSLFKVLFIFPSRYLFAIGLVSIFSFR